jgi:2,3-bisphosphoglycerate-dependent phosphoglycerate mutase
MSGTLVLVRHGQSEWNLKNLFTGWRDVDLSEQGHAEAKAAGARLNERGFTFDIAYTHIFVDDGRIDETTAGVRYAGTAQSDVNTIAVGLRYKFAP